MRSLSLPASDIERRARWAARALTAFHLALVLVMVVGLGAKGGFHPLKVRGVEPIQLMCFWAACVGMAAAWRWEVIGGALSLGGVILFIAVEVAVRGNLPRGPFLHLMLLPGVLFLLSGFISRRAGAARRRFSRGPGGRTCHVRAMGVQAPGRARADTRPTRRRGREVRTIEPGVTEQAG